MSSDRTNNATAFRVTFPHRTNISLKFVRIFLVAPILDAELCRSITVTPPSEAVQSSQPKTSGCLELLKIYNTVLLAFSPDLAALHFSPSRPLSLGDPSPPFESANSPTLSQGDKHPQQGGSCGHPASSTCCPTAFSVSSTAWRCKLVHLVNWCCLSMLVV